MHYMYMNWQAYQDAFGMNYAGRNDQVEPKVSGQLATLTVNRKAFPVKLAAAIAKGWIFGAETPAP
jgi:hypothetical protein